MYKSTPKMHRMHHTADQIYQNFWGGFSHGSHGEISQKQSLQWEWSSFLLRILDSYDEHRVCNPWVRDISPFKNPDSVLFTTFVHFHHSFTCDISKNPRLWKPTWLHPVAIASEDHPPGIPVFPNLFLSRNLRQKQHIN